MDIPGITLEFPCDTCTCASCDQGNISPNGSNSCGDGCIGCENGSHKKIECSSKTGGNK